MNHGNSGLAHGTSGSSQMTMENTELATKSKELEKTVVSKNSPFDEKGHVTINSLSSNLDSFLGKSVNEIESDMNKHGYTTKQRPSVHSGSRAKIIVTTNQSKDRNIQQVQVSPGSPRHGNVPYVKISTSDYGKIKLIDSDEAEYKTDGKENVALLFRRKK